MLDSLGTLTPEIFPLIHYESIGYDDEPSVIGSSTKKYAAFKQLENDLDWATKYLKSDHVPTRISRSPTPSSYKRSSSVVRMQYGRDSSPEFWDNEDYDGSSYTAVKVNRVRPASLARQSSYTSYNARDRTIPISASPNYAVSGGRNVYLRSSVPRSTPDRTFTPAVPYTPVKSYVSSLPPSGKSNYPQYNSQPVSSTPVASAYNAQSSTGNKPPYTTLRKKPEISETRQRLRKVICDSKNDPHYFDD